MESKERNREADVIVTDLAVPQYFFLLQKYLECFLHAWIKFQSYILCSSRPTCTSKGQCKTLLLHTNLVKMIPSNKATTTEQEFVLNVQSSLDNWVKLVQVFGRPAPPVTGGEL